MNDSVPDRQLAAALSAAATAEGHGADSSALLRNLLESAVDAIWFRDVAGLFQLVNPAAAAIMGVGQDEAAGRSVHDIWGPEAGARLAAEASAILAGGRAITVEEEMPDAGKQRVGTFVSNKVPIFAADGSPLGILGISRDITDRKAAEEAMRRTTAEFQALADNIPTLCWMAHADGDIYWYNKRWYDYTGTSAESQQGWGWESVHDPAFLPKVVERWRHSIATGTPFEMTFPLRAADGHFEPFLTRVVPIRDAGGAITHWFGTNTNVAALSQVETELRDSRARLAEQVSEFNALYESAPIGLAFFDRGHRYVRVNEQLAAINGVAAEDHIGRTVREVLGRYADDIEPVVEQVFVSGKAIGGVEASGESPTAPGVPRHWLAGFYPVRGPGGEVDAVGAWVIEISERKAAEQRELLLAREVDHRAKNLLAVVQSIVQLTPGSDGPALKASIIGRIQALARAHSLLSDARWDGVDLGQLVREELAPFRTGDAGRVSTDGPDLLLRPAAAQSLALVLHELATNAVKYGALSSGSGSVAVQWRRDAGADGAFLEIEWLERGGPDPGKPDLSGFGSKIIHASVNRQLRGQVTKEWLSDGLHCTIRIPAAELVPKSEP